VIIETGKINIFVYMNYEVTEDKDFYIIKKDGKQHLVLFKNMLNNNEKLDAPGQLGKPRIVWNRATRILMLIPDFGSSVKIEIP
jgi:hypothetical protein